MYTLDVYLWEPSKDVILTDLAESISRIQCTSLRWKKRQLVPGAFGATTLLLEFAVDDNHIAGVLEALATFAARQGQLIRSMVASSLSFAVHVLPMSNITVTLVGPAFTLIPQELRHVTQERSVKWAVEFFAADQNTKPLCVHETSRGWMHLDLFETAIKIFSPKSAFRDPCRAARPLVHIMTSSEAMFWADSLLLISREKHLATRLFGTNSTKADREKVLQSYWVDLENGRGIDISTKSISYKLRRCRTAEDINAALDEANAGEAWPYGGTLFLSSHVTHSVSGRLCIALEAELLDVEYFQQRLIASRNISDIELYCCDSKSVNTKPSQLSWLPLVEGPTLGCYDFHRELEKNRKEYDFLTNCDEVFIRAIGQFPVDASLSSWLKAAASQRFESSLCPTLQSTKSRLQSHVDRCDIAMNASPSDRIKSLKGILELEMQSLDQQIELFKSIRVFRVPSGEATRERILAAHIWSPPQGEIVDFITQMMTTHEARCVSGTLSNFPSSVLDSIKVVPGTQKTKAWRIVFFPTNNDCILVETATEFVFIDAGRYEADLDKVVAPYVAKLRDAKKTCKYVISSHCDSDHIRALPKLATMTKTEGIMMQDYTYDEHQHPIPKSKIEQIKNTLDNGNAAPEVASRSLNDARALRKVLAERKIHPSWAEPVTFTMGPLLFTLTQDDVARDTVSAATKQGEISNWSMVSNKSCLVWNVSDKNKRSAILTADAFYDTIHDAADTSLSIEVLQIPHHGSNNHYHKQHELAKVSHRHSIIVGFETDNSQRSEVGKHFQGLTSTHSNSGGDDPKIVIFDFPEKGKATKSVFPMP